jgi:DNA-binding FadR family transcriptional regulator
MQTLAHDSDLADYGNVVRAIEASDAEAAKAAMMQVLSHSADQLLGEAV